MSTNTLNNPEWSPWRRTVTDAQLRTPEERASDRQYMRRGYLSALRWIAWVFLFFVFAFSLGTEADIAEFNSPFVIHPIIEDCTQTPAADSCTR